MDPVLVLMSGLPGTGKSSLANELARRFQISVFSKDRFQSQLRVLGLAGRAGAEGYHLLFNMADQQLSLDVGVILDAAFRMPGFRRRVRAIAVQYDVPFRPIHCFCSDEALHKTRIETRDQQVPDWSPVGWEEVERIRAIFEPWEEAAVLHLDAAGDFKANVSQALAWITSKDGTWAAGQTSSS